MRWLKPELLSCLALLAGCGVDGEVDGSVQELRAGATANGRVLLSADVLFTDDSGSAIPCRPGDDVQVEVSFARDPQGPFTTVPGSSMRRRCVESGAGDLALVVDNSGSEEGRLASIQHAARSIVERVVPGGGRASLVRVSTAATTEATLTDDIATLDDAIDDLHVANGWTALNDGIRRANETLGGTIAERREFETEEEFCGSAAKVGIVAVTDGRENNSADEHASAAQYGDGLDTTAEDLRMLSVDGVTTPIYTVGIGNRVDHDALTDLANDTGGRHLRVDTAADVEGAFDTIADYFSSSHRLCTALPAEGCGDLYVHVNYRYGAGASFAHGERDYRISVPCDDKPRGRSAAVLMTLSDIDGPRDTAGRLAAQTVRWVGASSAPRVLVVLDDNHHGESPDDAQFVARLLRARGIPTTYLEEPSDGLTLAALTGYDVVWLSNPGYPVDDLSTMRAIDQFMAAGGGLVLQGDDMLQSWGAAFSMQPYTGASYVDNGTNGCGVWTDNNAGERYRVQVVQESHPVIAGLEGSSFLYGNDIDTGVASHGGEHVLASATVDDHGRPRCGTVSPVIIVRDRGE